MKKIISSLILFFAFTSACFAQYTTHVIVNDQTNKNPSHRKAEVWMKGEGSWYLNSSYNDNQLSNSGIVSKNLSSVAAGKTYSIHFYPDGRKGKDHKIKFEFTSDMCKNGCVVNSINIELKDHSIKVYGGPINTVYDETLTMKR